MNALTCSCQTWGRDPISDDGLPISEHHPHCMHYRLKRYLRVTVNGVVAIMNLEEFSNDAEELYGNLEDKCKIEFIEMTEDQFQNLEDFQGY